MDGSWEEVRAIRHVEPALAVQLELSRLSNYNLAPTFVQNKQPRIYHGVARKNQLDNRLPIRALVQLGRIRGGVSMAKHLISEIDRPATSILGPLEVMNANRCSGGYNHTFINFIYNLPMTYSDISEAVLDFTERHEKRPWRLHVTGSKMRICCGMKREMSPPFDASSRAFPLPRHLGRGTTVRL